MGCFSRHPLVGPSSAQKPYHNFSSLMFPAIWSTNLINACSSVALTVIFILNFYVHGSKSLYHIVGAPIWATNAPLLCDSRSKRSRWLFDRGSNSIQVETDDLPLLFGSWPLIDRDSDHNPMFIVFRKFVGVGFLLVLTSCAQNSQVGLKTRYVEMSTPCFFFQFECPLHLPSAFDSLFFATRFVEKKFDGRVLESQNVRCNC